MNTLGKVLIQSKEKLSFLKNSKVKHFLLSLTLFFIPVLLPDAQIVTGTIINFCLIYIAFNYKGFKTIPAIMLPSIANLIKGTMFGGFTPFLLIVMPAIWIGNFILVFSLKSFSAKKMPIMLNLLLSSILKALVIFGIAYITNQIIELPKAILNSMGLMQFVTACIASSFYYLTTKIKWQ